MRVDISAKDWLLAVGIILTAILFILARAYPVWPGDAAALAAIQEAQQPALTAFFRWVTFIGWLPAAIGLVAITVVLLLRLRQGADAALLLLLALPMALAPLLKLPVGRPRPEYGDIETLTLSLSFPSGHAAFAALFGGFLIYLVGRHCANPRRRYALTALLLLLILLIGLSRLYLGVHWPSDIIGGYLYGGMALAATIRLRDWLAARRRAGPGNCRQ